MIAGIELRLRRIRIHFSRTAWAVRHFELPPRTADGNSPGLVLIQIDGLSGTQLQRGLDSGKMPFLKSLTEKQPYEKHVLYSGLPSTTPSIQAELFYGVRQAVPEFCYYDKIGGRIFSMFEGEDARELQRRLEPQGEPLLKGGSAYSDIFTGGAAEAHFCMTQLGWPEIIRQASPVKLLLFMLLHVASLLRMVVLTVIELVLAVTDCCRGLIAKEDFRRELKFIPSRIAVCILMRELIVVRAAMDFMRGLPIIHMNFLGYDEQSHRRGPDSNFAHWTLKGIDHAVKRIYHAACRSLNRDYDVWIYSDHGQSKVTGYQALTGETVQTAVSRVFDQTMASSDAGRSGVQFHRASMLRTKRHRPETQPPDRLPIVTALGPLGCVYLETPFTLKARDMMGRALVEQAHIPMVFARDEPGRAVVWTENGSFILPDQKEDVLGRDHPFPAEVTADMIALTRHPQAGDFFICGFRPAAKAISFSCENGSHGGVSGEETGAFALLPADAPLPEDRQSALRISDIRAAALTFLRAHAPPVPSEKKEQITAQRSLRILTYNVHNCAGMDGYISPHRISRVIDREKPDIVALQEVDVGRKRSAWEDQAAVLARYLEMAHHFHPSIQVEEECYGNAILTRFPVELVRAGLLPYRSSWLVDEKRSALWVKINIGGGHHVNVINVHLGLWSRERRQQVESLLGSEWLLDPECRGPVILCGDLNSAPGSAVCGKLKRCLHDVQEFLPGHKPQGTFSSRFSFHRIDHVFVNDCFEVRNIRIPRTHLARVASDHLPLVADLHLLD